MRFGESVMLKDWRGDNQFVTVTNDESALVKTGLRIEMSWKGEDGIFRDPHNSRCWWKDVE